MHLRDSDKGKRMDGSYIEWEVEGVSLISLFSLFWQQATETASYFCHQVALKDDHQTMSKIVMYPQNFTSTKISALSIFRPLMHENCPNDM